VIVAVASGKGGTGKTTVAVSLALSLADGAQPGVEAPLLLDCDVEEPNSGLFLGAELAEQQDVGLLVPQVDLGLCIHCGRCGEVCQYHAIAPVGEKVLVFPELCHGCGSCTLNCPTEAISEVLSVMGTVERGWAGRLEFGQGTMDIGQVMGVPIIRHLKRWMIPEGASDDRLTILDAPPGSACPVVTTMRGADFVLLVTEPTPFGLHDLRIAIDVARGELGLPVGVVINRDGVGDRGVEEYCTAEGIPILMRIPIDRRIAEAYAEGIAPVVALPEYRSRFRELYAAIEQTIEEGRQ